jgi:hypothetical protein
VPASSASSAADDFALCSAGRAGDATCGYRADELEMVSFVLIGVQAGEAAYGRGKLLTFADVAGDGDRVSRACVGTGQCLATRGSELGKPGRDEFRGRDDLHVAELANVVILTVQRAPSDEDVGGTLDQPLSLDHPCPVTGGAARLGVFLVHRRPSLLDLQEQRVRTGAPLQEHQIDSHAHAAYSHDLADHIDHGEPVEQGAPVGLESHPVLRQQAVDELRLFVVGDRDPGPGAPK